MNLTKSISKIAAILPIAVLLNFPAEAQNDLSSLHSEFQSIRRYDNVDWHIDGDFPRGVSIDNAYTHTGFYNVWLARNKLLSDEMLQRHSSTIRRMMSRDVPPTDLYKELGGRLSSRVLKDEGVLFSDEYFELSNGKYLSDYADVFGAGATDYQVEPIWSNYDKIKPVLDQRFAEWQATRENKSKN